MAQTLHEPQPLRSPPRYHVSCPLCGDVIRDDCVQNHLEWTHQHAVSCHTCMDRRVLPDLWDGAGTVECPACFVGGETL